MPVRPVVGVLIGRRHHFVHGHHGGVAPRRKFPILVVHIGDTATHAGCKVAPGLAQHDHGATCHVLAAMVPSALHDRGGTRQAHRKALARHAAEERLTTGGTVHHGVAHNGVAHRLATEVNTGAHDNATPAQAFAGVIIGVANQVQRDALGQEGAERLAPGAFKLDADSVIGQAFGTGLGQRAGQHCTQRAVDVARHFHELHFFAAFYCGPGFLDQNVVQRFVQTVVLVCDMKARHISGHIGLGKKTAEIEALRLPVIDAFAGVQQVGAANQVIKLADAQLGHDLAHFFGNEEKEVHHVLRLAREFLAQCRVLRGDTDGASVQVAFAHHDAALHHQGCRGKAKLIRAEQCANRHVTSRLHLAIGLHPNAPTQAV